MKVQPLEKRFGVDMKDHIRDIWIAALRSGDYEEGRGQLCRIIGEKRVFCPLGVLCDIAYIRFSISERTLRGNDVLYDGCLAGLPKSIVGWAGLIGQEKLLDELALRFDGSWIYMQHSYIDIVSFIELSIFRKDQTSVGTLEEEFRNTKLNLPYGGLDGGPSEF